MKKYDGDKDFLRVRDFLKKNYFAYGKPMNWGLERWNWGRYHPVMFVEKDPAETKKRIARFEDTCRLCESESGDILGIINTEWPLSEGEFFLQRSPQGDDLIRDMLAYAVDNLSRSGEGNLHFPVYDYDEDLIEAARSCGFVRKENSLGHNAVRSLESIPEAKLERDFRILSMAEGADISRRCELLGRGFNHPNPTVWTTPAEYAQVQLAPDYRPELDLVVEAHDGTYASGCIAWYDDFNKIGFFEPVCTVPEYRRKGMGREVMGEAFRRLKALGAEKAFVGSSQKFYQALGFELTYPTHEWIKTFC